MQLDTNISIQLVWVLNYRCRGFNSDWAWNMTGKETGVLQ